MPDASLLETPAQTSAAVSTAQAEADLCFLQAGWCVRGSVLPRLPQPCLLLSPKVSWDADFTAGAEAAAAAAGGLTFPMGLCGVWIGN